MEQMVGDSGGGGVQTGFGGGVGGPRRGGGKGRKIKKKGKLPFTKRKMLEYSGTGGGGVGLFVQKRNEKRLANCSS